MTGSFKLGHTDRIIRILTGITFSFLSFSVYAQKDSTKFVKIDSSVVIARYPDAKSFEKFLNDRDYRYGEDPTPPENLLQKWIDIFFRKLNSFFAGKSYNDFWQYALLLAIVCAVVYFLYKTKALDFFFSADRRAQPDDYVVGYENIHEINFDEAIGHALSAGDFRLAIRLQYLKTLKMLTNRDLIRWSPNRTNQSYVQELEKSPYYGDFVQITRYFEFAWYGDFRINEIEFREMREFSDSFLEKTTKA